MEIMKNNKIVPKQKQIDFLNWEFGVFFHFGIRTFYEGHKDWDMQEMALCAFNPTKLDCDNWIKTVKDAGAKYAILVCKHHDGFANWKSKYTDYSVANTPWQNGCGDIVLEFVNACRKFDVKIGLYYSPAEFSSNGKNIKQYDDYFINQVTELLTNYGKIDYLWFDACGSEEHVYDTVRIIDNIRALQPNILIFNMWDPDTRWVGNEAGIAQSPCFNTVDALDFSVQTDEKTVLDEKLFLPAECDCRMRFKKWFYSQTDEDTVKSVDELLGLYYYSVGRGANLLINIGPDRNGLLPEKDVNNLIALGNEIKRRFEKPIPHSQEKNGSVYTLKFKKTLVNHIILQEDLEFGENVEQFRIYIRPNFSEKNILVYQGTSIGHKAICRFPTIDTSEIICEVFSSDDECRLSCIQIFYVCNC